MTTNAFTDNEVEQIEQCKRDTLHSLLRISMEQQGPQKFADLDVKGIAKKVNEAYDQLGLQVTTNGATVSPITALLDNRNLPLAARELLVGAVNELDEFKGREPEILIALPAGAGQTLKPWESSFNLPEGMTTGQVSDGYHTFDELYAHRVRLFSALMNVCALSAWWSRTHHDGSVWEGWILAGIETPAGTVTYHLPESEIPFLPGHTELPVGKEWDGHTADDVLERLKSL